MRDIINYGDEWGRADTGTGYVDTWGHKGIIETVGWQR